MHEDDNFPKAGSRSSPGSNNLPILIFVTEYVVIENLGYVIHATPP